jgi:hypothetical protein
MMPPQPMGTPRVAIGLRLPRRSSTFTLVRRPRQRIFGSPWSSLGAARAPRSSVQAVLPARQWFAGLELRRAD